jgi:rhodanese-related sulfurtransferase
MTILTHLRPAALMLAAGLCATAAQAEMPALEAAEIEAWAATYAEIKGMSPKWGHQGAEAFKTTSDAGVPVVYLDVRTEEERAKGVVEGAVEISLTALPTADGIAMLPEDKTALIAVYCKSGYRSGLAMPFLHRMGYTNAISMDGGYEGWVEAGYPVAGAGE